MSQCDAPEIRTEAALQPEMSSESPAADAGGTAPAGGPAAAAGEPLEVTRLAEISPHCRTEPRVLQVGTDTLELGVYVEFGRHWRRIVAKLKQHKAAAKRSGGKLILRKRCEISPGGRPNYPFHLRFAAFQIWLSHDSIPDGETPNAFIVIGSQLLWEQGERTAVETVLDELTRLTGGKVRGCCVSRGDLAADLYLPEPLTADLILDHSVGRSRQRRVYLDGEKLSTLYIGAKAASVELRIYDKSSEVANSGKDFQLRRWNLPVNENVWRFEFQLRRQFLRGRQIDTEEDWFQQRDVLWQYLTDKWFAMRLPDDPNVSRRSTHPLWQMVQSCAHLLGPCDRVLERRPPPVPSSLDPLVKQLASLVVGVGARRGLTDWKSALEMAQPLLAAEFEHRDFATECRRKAIALGIRFEEVAE